MRGFLVEGEVEWRGWWLVAGLWGWSPLLYCLACPVSGDHHGCQICQILNNIALIETERHERCKSFWLQYSIAAIKSVHSTVHIWLSKVWYVDVDVDRRRLSRLELYRVDTYSRVVGQTREEVRASRLGRSTSEEYGRMLAVRGRGRGRGRPLTSSDTRDSRDSRDSRRSQSHSHWAYFRSACPSPTFSDKRILRQLLIYSRRFIW